MHINPHERTGEHAPLLPRTEEALGEGRSRSRRPPWRQLTIIFFIRICDALANQSYQPYVTELVSGLDIVGGDPRKVGYYVGLLLTVYSSSAILTVFQWGRLSDRIGRKPVLLFSMAMEAISIICFGLSRTFTGLIASRCIWGLLGASPTVARSVIGEITDSSNRAQGYALSIVLWSIGATVGSLIGGTLARPSERFPTVFTSVIWKEYPYFLPCFAISVIVAVGFVITAMIFTETLQNKPPPFQQYGSEEIPPSTHEKFVSIKQLNTYPVFISVTNYLVLAFIYSGTNNIVPLFFATPIKYGGAGFGPARIGYILGAYFAFSAFFLVSFSTKLIRRFGERRVFICCISSLLATCFLLPLINICSWHFGTGSWYVWTGIILIAIPRACAELAHVCIYIFITGASPNKRSIGATNGLAQMIAIFAHTVSPATVTSLFAFSVQRGLLGGYAIYVALFLLTSFGVRMSLKMPPDPRPIWEED